MINRLFILLIVITLVGCNNCGDVDKWINEAPAALEEYLEVRGEVLTNQDFVEEFSSRNTIVLRDSKEDTIEYFKYPMPKLKEWFSKGRGMIIIEENGESVDYRICSKWREGSIYGTLYHGDRVGGQYVSTVIMIDSVGLKDGWYAHVTSYKETDPF